MRLHSFRLFRNFKEGSELIKDRKKSNSEMFSAKIIVDVKNSLYGGLSQIVIMKTYLYIK